MRTRESTRAALFALCLGVAGLLGFAGFAVAAEQRDAPPRSAASPAPAAQDRWSDPSWRTAALVLGGVAAVGFMQRRRRYD